MEHKHTPGPWGLRKTDSGPWAIFSADGIWIATTLRKQFPSEDEANARTMTASPDLLQAMQEVVATEMFLPDHPRRQAAYKACRAAIEKATGAQP